MAAVVGYYIGKSVTEVLSLGTTRRSYNLTYHASPEELYVNKNLKYSYSTAFQAIDYVIAKIDPSNDVVFQNDLLKHFTARVTTQIDIVRSVSKMSAALPVFSDTEIVKLTGKGVKFDNHVHVEYE